MFYSLLHLIIRLPIQLNYSLWITLIQYLVHRFDVDAFFCKCNIMVFAGILLVRGTSLPHLHPEVKILIRLWRGRGTITGIWFNWLRNILFNQFFIRNFFIFCQFIPVLVGISYLIPTLCQRGHLLQVFFIVAAVLWEKV